MRVLCVVVMWLEPEQPTGEITGYELQFRRDGKTTSMEKGDNDLFHEVQDSDVPGDVYVRVREFTMEEEKQHKFHLQHSKGFIVLRYFTHFSIRILLN